MTWICVNDDKCFGCHVCCKGPLIPTLPLEETIREFGYLTYLYAYRWTAMLSHGDQIFAYLGGDLLYSKAARKMHAHSPPRYNL